MWRLLEYTLDNTLFIITIVLLATATDEVEHSSSRCY